ncbi:uncharacterized protein (TIGR03084 family) [Streptacidiphilus sp. MAP12-16]|uniref:TIGR03084 family metal-binding protein n=1 Tax=Streptacidiphilus sp. MAP12-16 TaxID=3156300 RepID=UPI0035136F87
MPADLDALLADLDAESSELDALVAGLSDAQWQLATPAEGWDIAHQIAHLAWTDRAAVAAADPDPAPFEAVVAAALLVPDSFVDAGAEEGAHPPYDLLLARWREGRALVGTALAAWEAREPGRRMPWLGPPMSPASMATARMMETWAHGQDVAEALGVSLPATDRLRHIAHLGVRTRDFAFINRGETPPEGPFRVELASPSGELWTWGPEDAEQRVSASALDFCLLVTRRRHRNELKLTVQGAQAERWSDIAQAFAGPPGRGPAPRHS